MFSILSKILPIKSITTPIKTQNLAILMKEMDYLHYIAANNPYPFYSMNMTLEKLIKVLSLINAMHDSSEITAHGIIHKYIVNDGAVGSGLEVHDIDGKYSFHSSSIDICDALLRVLITPDTSSW